MAKTSRVLESRRFLKLVYITILGLISLVLVIIALIIIEDRQLKDSDNEKYEQIMLTTEDYEGEINSKEEEISSIQTTLLSIKIDDHYTRREQLTRLIDAYNDLVGITDDSLNELVQVENLVITLEQKNSARSSIYILEEIRNSTLEAIKKAADERNIVQYLIEIKKAIICFDEINTNRTSGAIKNSVTSCTEYINSARADINTLEEPFISTNAYLDQIEAYWDINIRLHKSIEDQNEKLAAELTDSLDKTETQLLKLESLSSEEISSFLKEEV